MSLIEEYCKHVEVWPPSARCLHREHVRILELLGRVLKNQETMIKAQQEILRVVQENRDTLNREFANLNDRLDAISAELSAVRDTTNTILSELREAGRAFER